MAKAASAGCARPGKERAATMTSDQVFAFFASVRDHVIAFFTQLPDRVLLPVWEWIINKHPEAAAALASLLVAVLVFRSAHKHNQLSVTPLLDITFGNYEMQPLLLAREQWNGPAHQVDQGHWCGRSSEAAHRRYARPTSRRPYRLDKISSIPTGAAFGGSRRRNHPAPASLYRGERIPKSLQHPTRHNTHRAGLAYATC